VENEGVLNTGIGFFCHDDISHL